MIALRFSEEKFTLILTLGDTLGAIGKAHDATPSQVALAWTLTQGEDFFVIPIAKEDKVRTVYLVIFLKVLTAVHSSPCWRISEAPR